MGTCAYCINTTEVSQGYATIRLGVPATVHEAAAVVLSRVARGLHDPVEGQEGAHDQLSHLSCPFDRIPGLS